MTKFVKYATSIESLELVVNEETGDIYASQSATARMCNTALSNIQYKVTDQRWTLLGAEIYTTKGLRTHQLLNEDQIFECLAKYNPSLLAQCAKAGLRVYLYGLAGYKFTAVAPEEAQPPRPNLKIVRQKIKASAEMRLLKQMLDMVPGLDETRKAATLFGHMAKYHPETSEMAETAISVLPSAPATEKTFTPTEIGNMFDPQVSAKAVNLKLIDAGLQESYRTAKGAIKYKATELGADHSVLTIESKANGTPTESLRWKKSVVDQLSIRAV